MPPPGPGQQGLRVKSLDHEGHDKERREREDTICHHLPGSHTCQQWQQQQQPGARACGSQPHDPEAFQLTLRGIGGQGREGGGGSNSSERGSQQGNSVCSLRYISHCVWWFRLVGLQAAVDEVAWCGWR